MIQLPKVLTGYFSTAKLNSALTLIEDWFNNNVVHRKDGSAVMEQDLDMNGNSIINAVTGSDPSSLVNKDYVDRVLPGLEASAAQSASSAAASASAAAQSETNAAQSESNAASIEATTLSHLKEFRDTYLGSYSSAPSQDPDGNPVNAGDLYFDTTLNEMRVYDGSAWKSVGSSINGTAKRQTFTGDGTTTTFTVIGGYDGNYADVYLNGVKLVNGQDVDVSSGTNVVFTTAPAAGDVIDVVAYGSFQLADMYTKAEIDQGQVVLDGIKNVDGAGSGLDADTLDGVELDRIVHGDNWTRTSYANNLMETVSGFYDTGDAPDRFSAGWQHLIQCRHANTVNNWAFQLGCAFDFDDVRFRRVKLGTAYPWQKIWHEGDAPVSFADNGYQKLPSGAIIQWGVVQVFPDSNGYVTVGYPIAFPNACLGVFCTDTWDGCLSFGVYPVNATNFSAWLKNADGSIPAAGNGLYIRFFAIGY